VHEGGGFTAPPGTRPSFKNWRPAGMNIAGRQMRKRKDFP